MLLNGDGTVTVTVTVLSESATDERRSPGVTKV